MDQQPLPQSTPQPQPVTPTPPPPPKNNSGILIGIFLLFLGILVGLTLAKTTILSAIRIPYLGVTPTPTLLPTPTPTPDPAAGWKTYINNQYDYSLKIPQDWIINAEEKSPAQSKIDPSQKNSKIRFNNKTSSVEIFYEGDWDHGFEPWVFEKKETIDLGGKDANRTILGLEGRSSKWHLISVESLNNFRIGANIDTDDNETFDQILSTFKFVDQNNQKNQTGGQQVNCPAMRPQVCSMLCVQPPPYICGSDGKSYCSECQACGAPGVSWYITQNTPCTIQ